VISIRTTVVAFLLVAACGAADKVDPKTLNGKVLFGYQGWFSCPSDPPKNWRSWARGTPTAETLTIDMYPDLSEFDRADLCEVPSLTIGGKPAYLYSAWNPKIVLRHFEWMQRYGLDGVLVQRFIGDTARKRESGDVVLRNIMAAAAATGRTFAIEYDITGGKEDTFAQVLREDWTYLVNEVKVTAHPNYQRHNGKPLLSVWGMGLNEPNHPPENPDTAKGLIQWLKSDAPAGLRVTYMGGTPSRWRLLANDARKDAKWAEVYAMMDVVQPWTVGRYRDLASADEWGKTMIEPDQALLKSRAQVYMPVIFPGFSWANVMRNRPERGAAPNRVPRQRGEFLWRQAVNVRAAGVTMLKIAMFDEVNESTAMYKVASHRKDAPDQGYWLTLDADGHDLPSDWYLRLAGEITRAFHSNKPLPAAIPVKPGPR
jgi:hypothetical protein